MDEDDTEYIQAQEPFDGDHANKVLERIKSAIDTYMTDCAQADTKPSLLGFCTDTIYTIGFRDGQKLGRLPATPTFDGALCERTGEGHKNYPHRH
jgi:hypothetical protein